MTAFSQVSKKIASFGKVYLEMRSLNHRYLEMVFHLPEGFSFLEEEIKKELEKGIYRGRINIFLNVEQEKFIKPYINKNLIKKYYQQLQFIKKSLSLKENPGLKILLGLPGVVSLSLDEEKKKDLWPKLKTYFVQLKKTFLKARLKEGRALAVDLKKRLKNIHLSVVGIKRHLPILIKQKTKDIGLDEEITKILKDIDISEELMRIEYHLRNFSTIIDRRNAAVGKELDFIAQEIQRETNTISAKSQDALVSSQVVNIKSQIEKIREQLQNVE